MNWIKELKHKTWIDWIKIIVAIDIASVGVGLVINLNLHVFANTLALISLGFVSRIIMGFMYVFVAILILKRVFPPILRDDEEINNKEENIDLDIEESLAKGKHRGRTFIKWIINYSDKFIDTIDNFLDSLENFFKKKKKEVKEEVHNLLKK